MFIGVSHVWLLKHWMPRHIRRRIPILLWELMMRNLSRCRKVIIRLGHRLGFSVGHPDEAIGVGRHFGAIRHAKIALELLVSGIV